MVQLIIVPRITILKRRSRSKTSDILRDRYFRLYDINFRKVKRLFCISSVTSIPTRWNVYFISRLRRIRMRIKILVDSTFKTKSATKALLMSPLAVKKWNASSLNFFFTFWQKVVKIMSLQKACTESVIYWPLSKLNSFLRTTKPQLEAPRHKETQSTDGLEKHSSTCLMVPNGTDLFSSEQYKEVNFTYATSSL